MKNIIFAVLSAVSMVATNCAFAAYDDVAVIKSVTPIQGEQAQQQQVCESIQVLAPAPQSRSITGSMLGGLAGALLGNQVGGGNGRMAATAVGAIAGAMTGDRVDNQQNMPQASQQQTCRWVRSSVPSVVGFLVTYEYNGRTYQNMLPFDPTQGGNSSLRVSVSVLPK